MGTHKNWYQSTVGEDTEKAASLKAGITTSTLNRQLARGTLSEGNVIAIARAYGQNPVEALVRTHYLSAEEVIGNPKRIAKMLTDQELIHELAMRIDDNEGIWQQTFSESISQETTHPSLSVISDAEVEGALEDVRSGLAAAKGGVDDYDEPEAP